jgi:hypothetical protein
MRIKNHPNIVVTNFRITGLFGKAYLKSSTAGIAAKALRKTGLFPCNRHMFDETEPDRISAQHRQLFA